MAGSLEEEMRKEIRQLDKAKEKLRSSVNVYVDPVLRDASIALQMSKTDIRKCRENIAALKEYCSICYEVEDVLRHKCGDASSISIDSAPHLQREDRGFIMSGLVIENESFLGSFSDDVSTSEPSIDETDILAASNTDVDGYASDTSDSSSKDTVLEQPTTRKDDVRSPEKTQEAQDDPVKVAIQVLEGLDASLRSHSGMASSIQSDPSLDEISLQSDKRDDTSLPTDESLDASLRFEHIGEEKGQMLLEAKFHFTSSLPIGLADILMAPDEELIPLSTRDGKWTLNYNQAEWNLDDKLDCFFPQHPGHYAIGVNWQQKGNGILKISAGTRKKRSWTVTRFPVSTCDSRTMTDGEIGRDRFKCFLSSDTGLWVSVCRLSFNPKLSSFTLTCQRCSASEGNTSAFKIPFYG